jgi:hypothetical protein
VKLVNKHLISDATTNNGKECFHCHNIKTGMKKNICDSCSRELEAWRNKKNKGKTEEKL